MDLLLPPGPQPAVHPADEVQPEVPDPRHPDVPVWSSPGLGVQDAVDQQNQPEKTTDHSQPCARLCKPHLAVAHLPGRPDASAQALGAKAIRPSTGAMTRPRSIRAASVPVLPSSTRVAAQDDWTMVSGPRAVRWQLAQQAAKASADTWQLQRRAKQTADAQAAAAVRMQAVFRGWIVRRHRCSQRQLCGQGQAP